MTRRLLFALLLHLMAGVVWAQPPFRVEFIGTAQGLTQGTVCALYKDSRGFVWAGTQDGLCRYDSHQFRAYRPATTDSTALVGLFVNRIIEAPNGDLWIGTDEALNQYHRQTDRFTPHRLRNGRGRALNNPVAPFLATNTAVWYWSGREGIVRYEPKTNKKRVVFDQFSFAFNYYVTQNATTFDRRGRLWIHADEGLVALDTATGQASRYFSKHPQNRLGPPLVFYDFLLARNGLLYLGYAGGFVQFDPDTGRYETVTTWQGKPLGEIFDFAEDPYGQIYLPTVYRGVVRYDPRRKTITQVRYRPIDQAKASTVYYLYHLDDGVIWLNEDPQALVKLNPYGPKFSVVNQQTHPALNCLNVRSFAETADSTLWVATLGGGLHRYNRQRDELAPPLLHRPGNARSLPGNVVRHLLTDRQGTLWVATDQGLARYEGHNRFKTFRPAGAKPNSGRSFIRHVAELDQRWLLVGTEDGLFQLDRQTGQFTEIPFFRGKIICFSVRDHDGRIWVGVNASGLYVGRLSNGQWNGTDSLLAGHTATDMHDDGRYCWVSTSKGLFRFNQLNEPPRVYDESAGLPNAFVYGIVQGGAGEFWLSTNRGLCRFDPKTGATRAFGPEDGVQSYEFSGNSFYRAHNGELFFGGSLGFNHFFPNRIRYNPHPPVVQFTNLTVAEKPYPLPTYIGETQTLTLPPADNSFALTYAALDVYSAGDNRYQYRMLGLDTNWIQAGTQTVARFIKLPPGDYRFEVRAANNDGIWSQPHRLTLALEAPFYQTIWFRLAMLVMLLAGLYGFYRYRLFTIRQQQQHDLATVIQTQEAERNRFAQELHDGIGANLATLKLYLANFGHDRIPVADLKARSLHLLNDSITDLRRLIDDFSPQSLATLGLAEALQQTANRLTDTGNLRVHLHTQAVPHTLDPIIETNLYRVVQELLQNALKHSGATLVQLSLTAQPGGLTLTYADNGRGFDPQVVGPHSHGLINVQNRVTLLGGHHTLTSAVGAGVQLRVDVPLAGKNA
jgi:signal transduction histidine kinase/ligand-binding sensor domain-containing protein